MYALYIYIFEYVPAQGGESHSSQDYFVYLFKRFSVGFGCLLGGLVRLRWNNREKHYTDRLKIIEVNIFDGCDSVVFFMRN